MTYSFEIHFDKYNRTTCLSDMRRIVVSGITIVAKNNKVGGLYFSKYVKSRNGNFSKVAGSIAYPILFTSCDKVVLKIEDFPKPPILEKDEKWHSHINLIKK